MGGPSGRLHVWQGTGLTLGVVRRFLPQESLVLPVAQGWPTTDGGDRSPGEH